MNHTMQRMRDMQSTFKEFLNKEITHISSRIYFNYVLFRHCKY